MSIHYDKLCQRVNIIPIFRVHNLHFDLITIQYLNGYSVGEFFFFFHRPHVCFSKACSLLYNWREKRDTITTNI